MKIFLDTADPEEIAKHAAEVDGFTTNPTLMRKADVADYLGYCRALVSSTDKPVSLEVLADDEDEIDRQAQILAGLGANVLVKVPVTLTSGEPYRLPDVPLNVTCVTQASQAERVADQASVVSLFAGRIADAGVDPTFIAEKCAKVLRGRAELLWASTREVLNIFQAEAAGCDIVTVSPELLVKSRGLGRSLAEVSLLSVRQFAADGAGYSL